MMTSLDLLFSLPFSDLLTFLWFFVLLDVPRYMLASITTLWDAPTPVPMNARITGIIACHNEERTVLRCIQSMRHNGVTQILVIDDGSTDRTADMASSLGINLISLPHRMGKPNAINAALPYVSGDYILIADADTIFAPNSIAQALGYFDGEDVGAVGFYLMPANAAASITTHVQAVEYAISFGAVRRLTDLLGLLSNVSGAASLFRARAVSDVEGWDVEVAEDAAMTMKLRSAGWKVHYAASAIAHTMVPHSMPALLEQRLRWDASILAIWWRKYRWMLDPTSSRFQLSNALTVLDVLAFGVIAPLILPVYLFVMLDRAGAGLGDILSAAIIAMAAVELFIAILIGLRPTLLLWWPWWFVVNLFVLRPLRVVALVSEALFKITRADPYIPPAERYKLI